MDNNAQADARGEEGAHPLGKPDMDETTEDIGSDEGEYEDSETGEWLRRMTGSSF
ncbi:hypothetical protein H2199_007221 [Coniosporium tulheliwenetii]|uniref:Uncharacterized protein n=1 Tax=Coniosporium tulheliwenetii TaxID=3383036 RepID=A0ACC2YR54_9PEZI|nr:hypothetical protein H2199_007221 [Cladosporium sp. JES 115]